MGSEWMPIDTAPKDGTRLLLADETQVAIGKYEIEVGKTLIAADEPYWQEYDYSNWDMECDDWFPPTHWQALPPVPENSHDRDG